jgi:Spy/CpxP family protein refolding chaperone
MGGGMSPAGLLGQESVQKELGLSDEQKQQVEELSKKTREQRQGLMDLDPQERSAKMRELREQNDKEVSKILKPEQHKRLHQITLQVQGLASALGNPKVAEEMQIKDDQKPQIKEIQDYVREQTRDLFQPGGNPDDARKKMEELRKTSNERVEKVLTAEQKAKWKELAGEPFKGEIRRGPPPGERGGR